MQADLQAEPRDIERAVVARTREAGQGLRTELRRQVRTWMVTPVAAWSMPVNRPAQDGR
jgi:hypothetical protein